MTTISKDESWQVIDAVRTEVADLIDTLTPDQRLQQSLCGAWTIRDVGAHLSMAARACARDSIGRGGPSPSQRTTSSRR